MDPYVSSVLLGIETQAWALDQARRAEEDTDDVAAVVAAEWSQVTVIDRFAAARGRHVQITCLDGSVIHGRCAEVGADWVCVRHTMFDAVPIRAVARVHGLPSALHREDVRRERWSAFLRGLVGHSVFVRTSPAVVSGRLVSVAHDHVTLDDGGAIPFEGMLSVRFGV